MTIKQQIFTLLDDDRYIPVFPTETVKRFYLSHYAKERRSAVLADRALAFDDFASRYAPSFKDRTPSNRYIRIFFAHDFLLLRGSELKYIYNPLYSETESRFASSVADILPSLGEMERTEIKKQELLEDLMLLRKAYGEFLDSNMLFEPGWFTHTVNEKSSEKTYLLVAYDAEPNMQKFMAETGDVPFIKGFSPEKDERTGYLSFENENAEITYLFDRLSELREKGVNGEDIIISTPDQKRLREHLMKASEERGIPLAFTSSVKLSETVAGRLFAALKGIYDEELSFYSLERLFMDPSFPLGDRETGRSIVMFMAANGLQKGSFKGADRTEGKLKHRNGYEKEYELYVKLKKSVRRLFSSDEMLQSLKILFSFLLADDEFESCPEETRDSYGFAIRELYRYTETLSELKVRINNPFSAFVSGLEKINYVSDVRGAGIKVYTYGEDYLLTVPYHFVIGLSDDSYKKKDVSLSFLDDREVVARRTIDVTFPLLSYYRASGENVIISGSDVTYGGNAAVPMAFLEEEEAVKTVKDYERRNEPDMAVLRSMRMSDGIASRHHRRSEEVRDALLIPSHEQCVSYSALSDYGECPFRDYLKRVLLIPAGNVDQFEPASVRTQDIGSFLHKAVEKFFTDHKGETLYHRNAESYVSELGKDFDDCLSQSHFDLYARSFISSSYRDGVTSVMDVFFSGFGDGLYVRDIEGAFESERDGRKFIGRYDLMLENREGRILLDFKTGSAEKNAKTFQLQFYSLVWSEKTGEEVGKLAYYSFSERNLRSPASEDNMSEAIEKYIEGTCEGVFTATPGKENCSLCDYRSVCRRRFFIQ
ncbi:MAG: PD-(D/E)XK nuclease family protein [Bullifex sp.]